LASLIYPFGGLAFSLLFFNNIEKINHSSRISLAFPFFWLVYNDDPSSVAITYFTAKVLWLEKCVPKPVFGDPKGGFPSEIFFQKN
jgi:hypothetical protein